MDSDSGLVIVIVLPDLSTAFSATEHILLQKLKHTVGFTGNMLHWF